MHEGIFLGLRNQGVEAIIAVNAELSQLARSGGNRRVRDGVQKKSYECEHQLGPT